MDALSVSYEIIPASIEEKEIRDQDYAIRAEKIARVKAKKILLQNPDAIVLAGDSFAVNNGKVFEKPENKTEAKKMLKEESGGNGKLYSGFCYLDKINNIDFSTTITVDFTMRTFTDQEIEPFTEKFPVLNWSGALFPGNIYGAGMVKEIKGSLSAFIYGFPIDLIIEYLQKSGITVNP